VEAVLSLPIEELKSRGESLLAQLPAGSARLLDSTVTTGGGSAPDEHFPSLSLELQGKEKPQKLLADLRSLEPPIIATIVEGKVRLNLATLLPEEVAVVGESLKHLLGAQR
jgi:seryl-tRNA(Sec) selenium transferase